MRSFLTAMALSVLLPLSAQAAEWQLDTAHSKVGFRVTHMMVTSVEGSFDELSATLDYEPGDLKNLSTEVTVQMESVDTQNGKRDDHLRNSDFFDVPNHPTMTFTSTKVKPGKDGSFDLIGDLTLRGVTKEITLHAKGLDSVVKDPWGNLRVGASATGTLNRQDFGVEWNQVLEAGGFAVSDEVEMRIDVVFTRPAA